MIAASGILTPQEQVDADPMLGARMIEVNYTSHVTTLTQTATRMRAQRHGTIVVLSSIAAIRPRKANYVYGSAKAGLDAFARGLTDALAGTGVRVLLVRPGFVIGRMTAQWGSLALMNSQGTGKIRLGCRSGLGGVVLKLGNVNPLSVTGVCEPWKLNGGPCTELPAKSTHSRK